MAELLEFFPRKLVALVTVPIVVGLLLLLLLFDLGPTAWALVVFTLLGGMLVLFVVVARTILLEQQRGAMEGEAAETEAGEDET